MVLKFSFLLLIAPKRWNYSFDGLNLCKNKRICVQFPTGLWPFQSRSQNCFVMFSKNIKIRFYENLFSYWSFIQFW